MERAMKKLHSRRGASILLALFLLLLATMVSTVIISAATTAAKRVHDDRGEQQEALRVSSAGKLIVQYLSDHDAYTRVTVNGTEEDKSYFLNLYGIKPCASGSGPWLEAFTESFKADPSASHTLVISAPGDENIRDVTMTLTLQEGSQDDPEPGASTVTARYTLKGELESGAQKIYLRAGLTHTRKVQPYEDEELVETKDAEGKVIDSQTVPHAVTETTQEWKLDTDSIRLAVSEGMLWREND